MDGCTTETQWTALCEADLPQCRAPISGTMDPEEVTALGSAET